MLFIFKNKTYDIFLQKKLIVFNVFNCLLRIFFKIIIQTYRIIKNKTLDIKIIFKNIQKQLKNIPNYQIKFYF